MMFERANVVHMGDLVFNRLYPYVDRPGGASVRGWVARLEEATAPSRPTRSTSSDTAARNSV